MTSSNRNILRVTGHLCGELLCFLCVWINGKVNNREAGDLIRYRAHYDVIALYVLNGDYELWQSNQQFPRITSKTLTKDFVEGKSTLVEIITWTWTNLTKISVAIWSHLAKMLKHCKQCMLLLLHMHLVCVVLALNVFQEALACIRYSQFT